MHNTHNHYCRQDLHIHTIFSTGDSAIVKEQTVKLVADIGHAETTGISDHFEYLYGDNYEIYRDEVRKYNFKLGTEVNGAEWTDAAVEYPFDYFIYHCWDNDNDYRALETLLNTGKPVIIAHPYATATRLDRVPSECLIEINNRYVFRYDWRSYFGNHTSRFRFVLGSDAHQPNWLNQNVARHVAVQLGVEEALLFE